jgi:hypothetical protein
MNYLVRILLVVELPVLLPTVFYVMTTGDYEFGAMLLPAVLLWSIALLVVFVRSAGLIAAERARQTLDVLLTTPLTLSALVGDKWRGLWRMMAVVSVPILIHAVLDGYLQTPQAGPRRMFYEQQGLDQTNSLTYVMVVAGNLVILLALAAQLAFLFGLAVKTQTRATFGVLGLFFGWCIVPIFLRVYGSFPRSILYYSPIGGIAANQISEIAMPHTSDARRFGEGPFYLLVHGGIYLTIVFVLAAINYWIAARVLVRPRVWGKTEPEVQHPQAKVAVQTGVSG